MELANNCRNFTKIKVQPEDLSLIAGSNAKVNITFEAEGTELAATNMRLNIESLEKLREPVKKGMVYITCQYQEYLGLIRSQKEKKKQFASDINNQAVKSICEVFDHIDSSGHITQEMYLAVKETVSEQINLLLADDYLAKIVLDTLSYDGDTHNHCVGVNLLILMFADYLNKKDISTYNFDIQQLGTGALLHDVGKIKVPKEILCLQRKLTDEEFAIIKSHPVWGKDMLEKGNVSQNILEMAYRHHQRPGGKGYPQDMLDIPIPEHMRIISIVDMYEALRSKRCYKPDWDIGRTINILEKDAQEGLIDSKMWGMFKGFLWEKTTDGYNYFRSNGYVKP